MLRRGQTRFAVLVLWYLCGALSAEAAPVFPVAYSTDSRYLVDQAGTPFPILGRTAWFVVSLTPADYRTFIDDTAARGYTAVEFHVLNHDPRGNNPPFNGAGDLPFLKRLSGSSWTGSLSYNNASTDAPDFTTPNEIYWSFVDSFLAYCESKGILVFMFPAYVGYANTDQGWMQEVVANGGSRMQTYGAWLANRYQAQKNLVWMMGGDRGTSPNTFDSAQTAAESGLLTGLKSVTGASTLFSAEWNSESIATDQTTFGSAMTLNGAYSWTGAVNTQGRRAFGHSPVEPAFLLEEPYDQEGPDGNSVNPSATQPVRRFQWWGWLSTIGGYISGNGYVWPFRSTWQSHLDTQGSRDMARLNAFVASLSWYRLKPSGLGGMKTIVTAGGSSAGSADYVAASAASDGSFVVAYLPPAHSGSVTVDMTTLGGAARARWFDPTSAVYTLVATGLSNSGSRTFTPPGANSAGSTDWVLVLDSTPSGVDTQSPTAPASLGATATSSSQINLSWTASTDNVGVTSYLIERCQGAGCTGFAQVGTSSGSSYNSSGLAAATSYSFRVRATDAAGNLSSYSNTASATTSASGGTGGIALVQHVSKDAGTTTSTTLAFTANNTAGNWIGVAIRAGQAGESFTVSDTHGNTYRKAVQLDETTDGNSVALYYAENIAGGPNTVSVTDTLADTLRVSILEYAGVANANSIDVTATGHGTGTTISTGTATTTAAGDLVLGLLSTANPASMTAGAGFVIEERVPAAPNTKLAVEDRTLATAGAVSTSGTLIAPDTWGAVLATFKRTGNADVQVPTAPTNLTATVVSSTQIDLSWTASSDNVGVTNYLVERCQGSGCANFAQVGTATGTNYSSTGLTAATSYSYRVRATDAAGNLSGYSNTASAAPSDTQAPTAPTSLTATVASSSQINLSWTVSNDNVGVTNYLVERCQGAACTAFAQVGTSTGSTYSSSGLAAATSYSFRVRATDAAGNLSGYSNTATATTAAGGGGSGVTLVQHVSKDAGTTTQTKLAFASRNTAGNWIAVAIRAEHPSQSFTVTDTRKNTYRKAVQLNETTYGSSVALYYAENIAGGANNMVTVADTQAGSLQVAILEYAGVAAANSLDVTAAGRGTGTAISSGSATTTAAGDLVIGVLSTANATTVASGAGFTFEERVSASPNTKLAVEDQRLGTAGTVAATGTLTASDTWGAVLAAFKPRSN